MPNNNSSERLRTLEVRLRLLAPNNIERAVLDALAVELERRHILGNIASSASRPDCRA